ncbi:MAG TPA: gliding motility-associated C-terminal domain-containing protein [Puia sp.]|nr:gliding motility-associated C-terminal domain-containing protein [Puia sp.]
MIVKCISFLLIALVLTFKLSAQCTTLGQTPGTAFPVCGTNDFAQTTVPLCSTANIPVPGCADGNVQYFDTNPFWYKFTCYQSGTLGFLITPTDLGDDYDWQLFDITGRDPNSVFTDPALFVSGNWSGSYGLTGASTSGTGNIECASNPAVYENTFSKMPQVIQGHNYLLLVSHYTQSQSGYKLSFGGGTASITDTTKPHLLSASVSCDATKIMVKLNKKMTCASLVNDGSDFTVSSALSSVISATGINCNSGFDMDSVILTLSNPLPPGNYQLTAKNGADGNTLLDNCSTQIVPGENIPFAILPIQPTPMDSLVPVGCSPDILQLVFSKLIRCNTIAPDGSDFQVTGPSGVIVSAASGICNSDGNSSIILVQLSAPITVGGTYQIKLVNGSDGSTIVDECGQTTPAGSTLNFSASDTVAASFNYQLLYGCRNDTLYFTQDGNHGINQWNWTFQDAGISILQNPEIIYPESDFGQKIIQLIVSNGVCSDTSSAIINLDNKLTADFEAPNILCPEDKAIFQNNSVGNIVSWTWDLGDGTLDFDQTPAAHSYTAPRAVQVVYTIRLIVENNLGCRDTAIQKLTELRSCYIAVPNAFTPNGDGINDYLYPLNALKAVDLEFKVYNRYGQLVFETRDWTKKWDGTINGKEQDTGTYVWTLQYTDGETGKKIFRKGTSTLIR